MKVCHRATIGIVACIILQPTVAESDALAFFFFDTKVTGSPGLDEKVGEICNASFGAGCLKVWISLCDFLRVSEFIGDDPGLYTRYISPFLNRILRKRDETLECGI